MSGAKSWLMAAKRPTWVSWSSISDEMRVRAAAAALWMLVVLAALGGLASWVWPDSGPGTGVPAAGQLAGDDSWEAAGFGARFVAAYLAAGPDGEDDLAGFLGYRPELPDTGAAATSVMPDVSVVDLERVVEGYWAVTVAAHTRDGGEAFWRVGVDQRNDHLVVAALPTPVSAPSAAGDPVELQPAAAEIPDPGDPEVQTVAGFVSAYLCGDGELTRYLAPGVVLEPVRPARCREVQVDRWGSWSQDDGRLVVLSEVLLDPGPGARRVAFPLVLSRRGDRWEVAELLLAPALAAVSVEGTEVVR